MKEHRPIFQPNELSNDAVVSMRTRVITGLIVIAVALPLVLFGDWAFFALVSVLLVLSVVEIIRCAKTKYSKALYIVAYILAFLILLWNVLKDIPNMNSDWRLFDSYSVVNVSVTIMFIGICLSAFTIIIDKNFTIIDACFIFTTIVIIALGFESGLFLRYYPAYLYHHPVSGTPPDVPYVNIYDNLGSSLLLVFVLLGACLNDAFAYFVGVFFGKHKMNERISPKKTWEGFFGGIILTAIVLSAFAFITAATNHSILPGFLEVKNWYHIVILSILIPLVSTLGDLVFSSIKRHYGIKDFSNVLPGHGGILDRFDSILFAAITTALYICIFFETSGGITLP